MKYANLNSIPRLLRLDSYKYSQYLQDPQELAFSQSYIESRGGRYPETQIAGVQGTVLGLFADPLTAEEVEEARDFATEHGEPFNYDGFMKIVNELNGVLPLKVVAVPDGEVVPYKKAILTIENTIAGYAWLPGMFETPLLKGVWNPTQVATTSWRIKKVILAYLRETGTPELIDFKLHDFGARACLAAAQNGAGHIQNFMGSDTVEAVYYVRQVYGDRMAAFSIPASEHSTMTVRGREGEVQQMENMIDQFGGEGKIYACVSDGYNIYNAVENIWGGVLKDKILAKGGTLVVRPDSGDPIEVNLRIINTLGEKFGYTINDKGFKVLNPAVRIIQGDGVDEVSVNAILATFKANRWSADNIAFGMGGALLQNHGRDDNKWAMKRCAGKNYDSTEWFPIFKDPITDPGKTSKKGFQTVEGGVVYYDNGITFSQTMIEVRARANKYV